MEINSSILLYNFTDNLNDEFLEIIHDSNIIHRIIIITYFVILLIGFCINLCLIICLLLQKKQGTMYIILQLSFVAILSTSVAATEIWSLHSENWNFNSILCPIFLGTEVLVNVLVIYLHILLNFHAISTWNMQTSNAEANKNPLTSDTDESNECLVWSESTVPNRTLNIDYRQKRNSVSIIIPSMLIWFSCLSLSIPEYTLSTTVEYHTNRTLCTIVDIHYTQLLQYLLVFFRDILPSLLLILTITIVLFKLCSSKSLSNVKKNSSAKKFIELKKLLLLSLLLSLLYIFFSFQRSLIQCLHAIFQQFDKQSAENFKMPPLDNIIVNKFTNMYFSMLHYCTIILRPIFCICIFPSTITYFKKYLFKNKDRSS